jgi:hypothetical protein
MLRCHLRSNPDPPASQVCPLTTSPVRYFCPKEIFVLAILCSSDFEMSIWDPKRFQMKKLSTIKFYKVAHLSRSTTFVLGISSSEIV